MKPLTAARMAPAGQLGTLRRQAVLAILLLVAPACFLGRKHDRSPAADAPEGEIALSVTNHSNFDVVIYVVHDGARTQVGMVTAASSTLFLLPTRLLGQGREVKLLGDPIGSRDYAQTETIIVQRGQQIDWTLQRDLRRSSVSVY